MSMQKVSNSGPKLMQGNEACAAGALAAGCRFMAGYPITPATEIPEYLSDKMFAAGGVFMQMEDELASINAVIGASWGGARAMTATSGPGFTLMQEGIGYAIVSETPLVIVNVMRGGPATGQPTCTAQDAVMQARYGGHGDYEIIALTPSSVQETFDFTVRAFNLADKYRVPVFVLSDETVGHTREKLVIPDEVEIFDEKFEGRCTAYFQPDEHKIPPRIRCFEGHNVLVDGQLHDERGIRAGTDPKVCAVTATRISTPSTTSHPWKASSWMMPRPWSWPMVPSAAALCPPFAARATSSTRSACSSSIPSGPSRKKRSVPPAPTPSA